MTTTQLTIAIIIILIGFILLRRKKEATQTQTGIFNIDNPKIVLLQIGTQTQLQLDSDKTIYSDFYSNVTTKTVNTLEEFKDFIINSSFDLFHLFVDIDKEGKVFDASQIKIDISELIDLMQIRSAKYIFFAKDNPFDGYNNGGKGLKNTANIVMTLERKGNNFTYFFKKVFLKVSKGEPFPIAWNEIAPQIPGATHDNIPGTLAIMGARNVVLLADK